MNNTKDKYAIIVAGGSGKRMGSNTPKQFIEIAKAPILMHSINKFTKADKTIKIILVLPENQHNYWNKLIIKYNFKTKHTLVNGGEERFHSVLNGLKHIRKDSFVAIHDGVRPLVSTNTINNCFKAVINNKAVIPVIPVIESIRKKEGNTNFAVNRDNYVTVQTPQVFDSNIILNAYEQAFNSTFTDDASVVEQLGHKIHLIEGNIENIKITQPIDLKIAELFLKNSII